MKRRVIGSIAFFATFAVGVLLGWPLVTERSPQHSEELHQIPTQTVVSAPFTDDFIPEFTNLPNFEDLKYTKPTGKLIELLDDGIYRRSEIRAKNGESWMVLTENGGELSFYPRKAKVRQLKTVTWPGDERDAKLSFNVLGTPIIAVGNIEAIKPGPVTTLFHQKRWAENEDGSPDSVEISDGFRREYTLGSNDFVLRTSRGLTSDGTKVAVLILESNGTIQIIKQIRHFGGDRDIFGDLLWVGDMDGDGKLDLYFDEFNEKGFSYTELHLSSQATQGKLVGFAADFGMAGC
jgi:hypothetical protein